MSGLQQIFISRVIIISILLMVISACSEKKAENPFTVADLFDHNKPETLGLRYAPDLETYTIFAPGDDDNKYNHGVVLYPYKNMLYAQWQSSSIDEDAPDTHVFYSRSSDGVVWSEPDTLAAADSNHYKTSGGWLSYGDTLFAFITIWNTHDENKEGFTQYKYSTDGVTWSKLLPVINKNGNILKGVIEQDLRALPDGRIITTFHIPPGLTAKPFYTDDHFRSERLGYGKYGKSSL